MIVKIKPTTCLFFIAWLLAIATCRDCFAGEMNYRKMVLSRLEQIYEDPTDQVIKLNDITFFNRLIKTDCTFQSEDIQTAFEEILGKYLSTPSVEKRERLVHFTTAMFSHIDWQHFAKLKTFLIFERDESLANDFRRFLAFCDLLKYANMHISVYENVVASKFVVEGLKNSNEDIELMGFGIKYLVDQSLHRLHSKEEAIQDISVPLKEKIIEITKQGHESDLYWMLWGLAQGFVNNSKYHDEKVKLIHEMELTHLLDKLFIREKLQTLPELTYDKFLKTLRAQHIIGNKVRGFKYH